MQTTHKIQPEGVLDFYSLVIRNDIIATIVRFYHAFKVESAVMAS